MTHDQPATRASEDGGPVHITPVGVALLRVVLRLAIEDRAKSLPAAFGAEHRRRRGRLRQMIDLLDALETDHGNA